MANNEVKLSLVRVRHERDQTRYHVVYLRFADEASAIVAVLHNERVGTYSRMCDSRALLPMISRDGGEYEEVSLCNGSEA
jgi:hypothetical protein